jgi:hypothetical protein
MGYCRKCGTKLEDNMTYCPKCGTPVAIQETYRPARYDDRGLNTIALAGVATLVAVVIIIIAIVSIGLIPSGGFPGPIIGSGDLQTQQINVTDFTGVEAGNGFNVQITQASNYSIKITAQENILQYIDVNKTGSTLTIKLRSGIAFTTSTLKAEITMPDIEHAQFSSGVTASAQGFNMTHNFNTILSGGSRFTMTGSANFLTAVGSGGSNLQFGDFKVQDANVATVMLPTTMTGTRAFHCGRTCTR